MIRLEEYPTLRVTRAHLRAIDEGVSSYCGPSLVSHGGSIALDPGLGVVTFHDSVQLKGFFSAASGTTIVVEGDLAVNGDITVVQNLTAHGSIKAFRNIESASGSVTADGGIQSVLGYLAAAGDLRSGLAMRAARIQSYQGSVVSQIEGIAAHQSSIVAGCNIWSAQGVTAVEEIRATRSITAKQSIRGGDLHAVIHILAGWDIAARTITAGATLGAGYAGDAEGPGGVRRDGIVGEILQGRVVRGVSLLHNPPIPDSEIAAHHASRHDALIIANGQFSRHHDDRNNARMRRPAFTRLI